VLPIIADFNPFSPYSRNLLLILEINYTMKNTTTAQDLYFTTRGFEKSAQAILILPWIINFGNFAPKQRLCCRNGRSKSLY
jgi:hypothetical protein